MPPPLILLVEDDPMLAALLRQVLKIRGYEVVIAQNAEEALDFSESHRVELGLLLCDVMLQGACGPEVACSIAKICPEMKTLFVSGYPLDILAASDALKIDTFQDGKAFYLQKPFRPKELVAVVQNILPLQSAPATFACARAGATYVSAAYIEDEMLDPCVRAPMRARLWIDAIIS